MRTTPYLIAAAVAAVFLAAPATAAAPALAAPADSAPLSPPYYYPDTRKAYPKPAKNVPEMFCESVSVDGDTLKGQNCADRANINWPPGVAIAGTITSATDEPVKTYDCTAVTVSTSTWGDVTGEGCTLARTY
ncbi:hypothetical protein [Nocardia sp. NPDC050435]|uniref:hypothetical protein n=1 Tax=Nocardia sp. NPDC050435 TaxID=3155040 RepID=UPI0034109E54